LYGTRRRLGDNSYYITAGGASAQHDWDWIATVIQDKRFDCTMVDRTTEFGVLSLQVADDGVCFSLVITGFRLQVFPRKGRVA
jgi:hypothetical protein